MLGVSARDSRIIELKTHQDLFLCVCGPTFQTNISDHRLSLEDSKYPRQDNMMLGVSARGRNIIATKIAKENSDGFLHQPA
jgi:hypothetical protein